MDFSASTSVKQNFGVLTFKVRTIKDRNGMDLLLLLLLSCFSHVRLCATPQTAAHQAPSSLGFSGKNIGVGCHFLLQCMKREK